MPNYGMNNTSLQTTPIIERVLFVFAGIALYNTLELLVSISLRFEQASGLYFWSLLIATLGIIPYTLGLLFKFFGVIHGYPGVYGAIAMVVVGWHTMVTGQSIVLYSRLHIICHRPQVLRGILAMILVNWFVSNIPTTVFVFGAASANPEPFVKPYDVWERLQLILYFTQETIISLLYVYEVTRMLKPDVFDMQRRKRRRSSFAKKAWKNEGAKKILWHLISINVFIVMLDVTLLITEFTGHYDVQVLYKALVYSIKLKLEFKVLNQLTDIAQENMRSSQSNFSDRVHYRASDLGSPLTGISGMTESDPRRVSDISGMSPRNTNGVGFGSLSEKNKSRPGSESDAGEGSSRHDSSRVKSRQASCICPLEASCKPLLMREASPGKLGDPLRKDDIDMSALKGQATSRVDEVK